MNKIVITSRGQQLHTQLLSLQAIPTQRPFLTPRASQPSQRYEDLLNSRQLQQKVQQLRWCKGKRLDYRIRQMEKQVDRSYSRYMDQVGRNEVTTRIVQQKLSRLSKK